jgi:hypothetical protein
MTTWYRIRTYVGFPEPVEVEKETDKFVVIRLNLDCSRRVAKESDIETVRRTTAECWQWLIEHRRKDRDVAQENLAYAQGKLDEAVRMAGEAEVHGIEET